MKLPRRRFLHLAVGSATLPIGSPFAFAQAYPIRTITVVVPFAAGGATDITARIIAEHMSRTLGQQLRVENVVGAGGTTGTTRAMRANPDGYTIMMGQLGTHALSVALYPDLAYRPDVDFSPIGRVVDQAMVIVSRKDFPPKDLAEFVSYVQTHSARLNTGHAGVGSITHGTVLLLNSVLGVKPVMVPFNGSGPALNALIAGQTDYMCSPIPDVVQQVMSEMIKAFAIGSSERSAALPNVPTSRRVDCLVSRPLDGSVSSPPKTCQSPYLTN